MLMGKELACFLQCISSLFRQAGKRGKTAPRRTGGRRRLVMDMPARESMEFDVVVVGAGPAGLAAAIRLKQLSVDTSVVVVEKGSEVGAHIMSGAVIDPSALDVLLPDWRSEDTPIKPAVADHRFYMLTPDVH